MQCNTAMGKKRQAVGPDHFHPFARRARKIKLSKDELRASLNQMVGLKERVDIKRTRTESR